MVMFMMKLLLRLLLLLRMGTITMRLQLLVVHETVVGIVDVVVIVVCVATDVGIR